MKQFMRCFFVFIACFSPVFSQNSSHINIECLQEIETLINIAIQNNELPGAVVLVSHQDRIVYHQAFGNRCVYPAIEPMTTDTIFDLSSLTKLFTATAVVKLAELGLIKIHAPVATYIPEFGKNGKTKITIKQLLTHSSCLISDNPHKDYDNGYEKAFENIYNLAPEKRPGSSFMYSSVGYLILGELVQRVSGKSLAAFLYEYIFKPLTMTDTMFMPPQELHARIAPTAQRYGVWIRGEVHDYRSHAIGGITGHAGLFSTTLDLAKFCSAFLNQGHAFLCESDATLKDPARSENILEPLSIESMLSPCKIASDTRGLGWDIDTRYSTLRGDFFREGAYGHSGFTGTSILLHQPSKTVLIILSNRVHTNKNGNIIPLRAKIANVVAHALMKNTNLSDEI